MTNKPLQRGAQVSRATSAEKSSGRHQEIARRYAWDDRHRLARRRPRLFAMLRLRELERFFAHCYGATLPDDDAGRDDLFVAAQHIAQAGAPEQHVRAWASLWCPWLSDDECAALIDRVVRRPLRWTADTLAWRIGLNDATRTMLKITTIGAIDCNKAQRVKRRKTAKKLKIAARRRIASRPGLEASTKPWEACNISRATWYRRGKPTGNETVRQIPYPADRIHMLGTDLSHTFEQA